MNPMIEKYRVRGNNPWSTNAGNNFGAFMIPTIPGKPPLRVICSPLGEGDWDHVSVSLPNRCPSWDEMSKIKSMFWNDSDCVVQFHPPESDYVNNHPYCLHLWKWNKGEMPRPPSDLVGIKSLGTLT
jgi:hypothetical protein